MSAPSVVAAPPTHRTKHSALRPGNVLDNGTSKDLVKATITVVTPAGARCTGLTVRGRVKVLIQHPVVGWKSAVRISEGSYGLELNALPGTRVFEFEAEGRDSKGVSWEGRRVVRWTLVRMNPGVEAPRREVTIVLSRQGREVETRPTSDALAAAAVLDPSGFVLREVDELMDSLSANLPSASMAVAGQLLDGLIKARGRKDGWWDRDWDRLPLGPLLELEPIKTRLSKAMGSGGWERLRGSGVYVRNVAAHHKGDSPSMEEALASARVIYDLMERW